MFKLCNSGIDFLPTEIMKEDKISGWLATDYMKVIKVFLWLFRNYGLIIENKYNNPSINPMKCNTKTYLTYLKLYNLNIPKILEDRRDIVWKHKELMIMNSKMIRQVKIEPIVRALHELAAQLMTLNEINIENHKIHLKQYTNELNNINKLAKTMTNDSNKKSIRLLQYNNLNLNNLLYEI